MLQIPDPIHGYIELDGMFAHIVNTPEFQRLRSVEQGSFRPVYPGARHDRFSHSLGTYHLAAQFVEYFFENMRKDTGVVVESAERETLSLTFRYAALLHDIGHAPFSHTTEGFFMENEDPDGTPVVWRQLCEAVGGINSEEESLFRSGGVVGHPHEIVSALLLICSRKHFLEGQEAAKIDLPLATRMVIGKTYQAGDRTDLSGDQLGIRNCLIQLLNCSLLDVDRLDYMVRDTRMSGYANAPLDLHCLAQSVTAVRGADGMPVNAYRDAALRVFDLMFQAKLSHDAWVLAVPAGAYEAALRAHCVRSLHKDYIKKVFTVEALGRDGVRFNHKTYRLLSDVDVTADLKAKRGEPFAELFTRELGKRRIAAWRSYYEFHHLFHCPELGLTPEKVYRFFKPLLKYMKREHLFVFDAAAYEVISTSGDADAGKAAALLREFLRKAHSTKKVDEKYNVVLLDRTNSFTLKLDPTQIRIVFPNREDGKPRLPLRSGKYNYSTYAELTGGASKVNHKADYFYIMRHGGLGYEQLQTLRQMLAEELKK